MSSTDVSAYQEQNNFFFVDKKEIANNAAANDEYKHTRCYTCKPRGKVKKHIISSTGNYVFHHDMNHRPLIIVTPIKHYRNIYEIGPNELYEMFNAISSFCKFWNIVDYQLMFNNGAWQTHGHFHIKLKLNEKVVERMRGDHFRKLKFEENITKGFVPTVAGAQKFNQ